jgi:hypothetical protein
MRKVKMKLLSKCDKKIQVVKLIKDCTGLGLRESKDIADDMFNNIGLVREIELVDPYYNRDGELVKPYDLFTSKIKEFGDFQLSGGLSWDRELKMLSLGLGEKEDYVNFLSEYIPLSSVEESKDILNLVLSKLENKDLIECINKIKLL